MSWWSRLRLAVGGGRNAVGSVAGTWRVVDISKPHPFASYVLELRKDGTLAWQAVVPTTDAGTIDVSGSGSWHTDGSTLHYVSGEHAGTCTYSMEGENLVLAGLPATKLGSDVRCVLSPSENAS